MAAVYPTHYLRLYRNDGPDGFVDVTYEAGVTQLREVWAGEAHRQQHSHVVHFGLAAASTIDTLTVRWPNGSVELITGASPRGRFRVVEGSGVATSMDG